METPMEQEPKSRGQVDGSIIYKDNMRLNRKKLMPQRYTTYFWIYEVKCEQGKISCQIQTMKI